MGDKPIRLHKYDEDAVCKVCGFDGAEWHYWRFNTYEGQALKTPAPPCDEAQTPLQEEA